jgi:hypothetical protein
MQDVAFASRSTGAARVELRAWYAERLLPRLVEAADAGVILPEEAAKLDRSLRELLGRDETAGS